MNCQRQGSCVLVLQLLVNIHSARAVCKKKGTFFFLSIRLGSHICGAGNTANPVLFPDPHHIEITRHSCKPAWGVNVKFATPQNDLQNAVRLTESDYMQSDSGAGKKKALHLFCADWV